jgi:hypothetical protein
MNSLSELKEYLLKEKIQIKEFSGWYLKIGDDTWTMFNSVFYCNGYPQKIKDKIFFEKYKKIEKKYCSIKKIKSAKFIEIQAEE